MLKAPRSPYIPKTHKFWVLSLLNRSSLKKGYKKISCKPSRHRWTTMGFLSQSQKSTKPNKLKQKHCKKPNKTSLKRVANKQTKPINFRNEISTVRVRIGPRIQGKIEGWRLWEREARQVLGRMKTIMVSVYGI